MRITVYVYVQRYYPNTYLQRTERWDGNGASRSEKKRQNAKEEGGCSVIICIYEEQKGKESI